MDLWEDVQSDLIDFTDGDLTCDWDDFDCAFDESLETTSQVSSMVSTGS